MHMFVKTNQTTYKCLNGNLSWNYISYYKSPNHNKTDMSPPIIFTPQSTHRRSLSALFYLFCSFFRIPKTFRAHICIHSPCQAYFIPALFAKRSYGKEPVGVECDICTGASYSLFACLLFEIWWMMWDKLMTIEFPVLPRWQRIDILIRLSEDNLFFQAPLKL